MAAGSSTNRMSGPARILDAKAVSGTGSATNITFDEAACNCILLSSSGSVTVVKNKDAASLTIAGLAVGVWHPMPDFSTVTTCPANTTVGVAQ